MRSELSKLEGRGFVHGQVEEQQLEANSKSSSWADKVSRFRAHKDNPRAADTALYKHSSKNRRNNLLNNMTAAVGHANEQRAREEAIAARKKYGKGGLAKDGGDLLDFKPDRRSGMASQLLPSERALLEGR